MRSRFDDAAADVPGDRARAVRDLERGEHLCSFHASDEDRWRLTAAFVAGALGAGDRVLCVAGAPEAAVVRVLAESGVHAGEPLRSGQLGVLDLTAVCGPPGDMDLELVLAVYREEAAHTRAAGFPGLRLAVEMGPFVEALGSPDGLVQWEEVVGPALRQAEITTVCQYDARHFSGVSRSPLVATHTGMAIDDGRRPLATFSAPGRSELRVAGELDVSNAPSLAGALRARGRRGGRLYVDLGGVAFVDVAALRTLFEVAAGLPQGSVLVLRRTPDRVQRLLGLLGWHDPRLELEAS